MPSFQPKARTIDHLGKSQIADMPTAVLELWKNGYDAYGDNMTCELFTPGSINSLDNYLMTLSDDGIGMSKDDVEDVWLTIGTDSKTRGIEKLFKDERLGKDERLKMGEKGIGRLSIAYLGSPMLMITKKINEDPVLLLSDWRVFTNYNLYLSDIDIPVVQGSNITECINELQNIFLQNIDNGNWNEHLELLSQIKQSILNIKLYEHLDSQLVKKFTDNNSHGTMFIVFEFDNDQIGVDSRTNFSSDNFNSDLEATAGWRAELRASLSGMINPFKETHSNIITSCIVHRKDSSYDLIAKGNFFDFEDIDKCEHSVQGKFDENGLFTGIVKVYGEKFNYSFRPNRIPGFTPYGEFELKLGHIEGEFSNSIMNEDLYRSMTKKMEAFGGLYIYKNDFRILPYGRQEYDFLKFEERRSKRAGTYVFSHRKMTGYIGITNKNKGFKEKAGREGFIDNKTYKEFKRDLIELFIDIAKRYYATSSNKKIEEHEKTYRQIENEKLKVKQKLIDNQEKLKARKTKKRFKELLQENAPLLDELSEKMLLIERKLDFLSNDLLISLEKYESLEDELALVRERFHRLKLTGFSRLKFNDKEKHIFEEHKKKEYALNKTIDTLVIKSDAIRSQFEVKDLSRLLDKKLANKKQDFTKLLSEFRQSFHSGVIKLESHYKEKENSFKEILDELLSNIELENLQSTEQLADAINQVEQIYLSLEERIVETFTPFIEHITELDTEVDEDKLTGFYKTQYEEIKEKAESMYELSQLGMAIEIIDHQFNVLYSSVASSIKNLNSNIPDTKVAKENLETLRHAIEHLENNHRLLTPLYRSNRRVKRDILGEKLLNYLKKFFSDKLLINGNTIIETNEEFAKYQFYTFPSVLQPVFINIINNALYWLNSTAPSERKILIHKHGNEILIENSGKPIDDYDLKNVFKLFFSRRPSGRGIGLHLAKTNLHTIDMDIYATNTHEKRQLNGGCFVIKSNTEKEL